MEEENGLLFPKGEKTKKKKIHSRSIVSKSTYCYICGRIGYTEVHHIFGGPNRQLSEQYGLTVRLCEYCHRVSSTAVHKDGDTMEYIHLRGQQAFEAKYSHEEFMKIFGRNYIEDRLVELYGNPFREGVEYT